MQEYLDSMSDDVEKAHDSLVKDLAKIRTGRATPKLVDGVQVNVVSYGSVMPINQLATIQAPDPRLLVVTPWDKSTIGDIEKGIIAAGLGLNPQSDGTLIRIPVPPLSADRRQDLVKQVKKLAEEYKVRIRQTRREYNELAKEAEKDGDITEDQSTRLLEKIQESTDKAIERVDSLVGAKEKEVLEV